MRPILFRVVPELGVLALAVPDGSGADLLAGVIEASRRATPSESAALHAQLVEAGHEDLIVFRSVEAVQAWREARKR